jgi:hypothetical protein
MQKMHRENKNAEQRRDEAVVESDSGMYKDAVCSS